MKSTIRAFLLALVFCMGNTSRAAEEQPANLIGNPGFEEPVISQAGVAPGAPWNLFSNKLTLMELTRTIKRSGEQSLKITSQKIPNAYQGFNQTVPVKTGEKYTFSAYMINNKEDPLSGTTHAQLVIEWVNEQGKEISRDYSQVITSSLSKMRWELITLRKKAAPGGAVSARFGIHLSEGEKGGKGSIFVDDVFLQE
jgi:hypothetical protein